MGPIFWTSYIVLCFLVVTLLVAVFGLYQHFARIYLMTDDGRDAQGPEVGTRMRVPRLAEVHSGTIREVFAEGDPTVLLFMSQECPICKKIKIALLDQPRNAELPVSAIILSGASSGEANAWAESLRVPVFLDSSGRLTARLGIDAIPFCIAIDKSGRVVSKGIVNDLNGLEIASADARALQLQDVSNASVSVAQGEERNNG